MDKVKEVINKLYASIKKVNNQLLIKSNEPYYIGASFYDAINLTITSNALSLIKSFMQHNHYSITNALNMRDIIESYTLLKMDEVGDISDKQKELFLEQYKIIEFRSYSKTEKRNYGLLIEDLELETAYDNAKKKYLDSGFTEKQFLKLKKVEFHFCAKIRLALMSL